MKLTVKLIDISHQDWIHYAEEFNIRWKTNYIVNKDSYFWIIEEEAYFDLLEIQQELKKQNKTIILNKGGI